MADPVVIPNVASIKDFVGRRFGPSEWIPVTQEQIHLFADATGDHQWIHVDVERAERESPFGKPIAHGYLTLALIPRLLPEVVRIEGFRLGVNYGLERMRLPAPVPAGSRVRLLAELKDAREMPGGASRALFGVTIEVEGSAKPACVADVIYVYYP